MGIVPEVGAWAGLYANGKGEDEIDSSKAKNVSGIESADNTVPVESYSANAFGVYDTAGNISEWVKDCLLNANYKCAPNDGSAWVSEDGCKQRVLHCGTFLILSASLRSAYRVEFDSQVGTTT